MRHSSLPVHPKWWSPSYPQAYHEKKFEAFLKVTYKETDIGVCMCSSWAWPSEGKCISVVPTKFCFYQMCRISLNTSSELWTGVRISALCGTCRRWRWRSCTDSAQVCPPRGQPGPCHCPLIVIIESLSILGRKHKRSEKFMYLSQIFCTQLQYTYWGKNTCFIATLFFLLLSWGFFFFF